MQVVCAQSFLVRLDVLQCGTIIGTALDGEKAVDTHVGRGDRVEDLGHMVKFLVRANKLYEESPHTYYHRQPTREFTPVVPPPPRKKPGPKGRNSEKTNG